MTHRGTVRETYGAALRLGEVTPGPDDVVVEVGSGPSESFVRTRSDADVAATRSLAPPRQLRFDLERARGRLDPEEAWEAVGYAAQYREFLESDPTARAELDRIRRRLTTGGTVWLVCPGNTPDERRHRAILAELLGKDVRSDGGAAVRR
ncbi:hypothetical protein C2R22_16445 [Salinigranum rubrum]|uniref:DUF488 domain-containing protein n=1 Tax=Salinigranum rubrum TaxID=755307 RepID=A0A2I8VM73_9EURY|nr:hypothetical protein [Salinigranum rubrum]AUV83037.1 hypothetical protein C2R22_16445 [Salinigranum rubrum]